MTSMIALDPEEVTRMGNEVKLKQVEIKDLLDRLEKMMNTLRGSFKGHLAAQIFSKWDEFHPNLSNSLNGLDAAGEILKKASDAFRQVDETRL
jgi:WXG100 family type VII secretion target